MPPSLDVKMMTLLLTLLHCVYTTGGENLDYTDIESMGMSCFPKDSCNRNIQLSFENRTCECDSACDNFNDCCIDAPTNSRITHNDATRTDEEFECLAYESALGAYAITKCPLNYEGPSEVSTKCANEEDTSDPFAAAPVTDTATNITYRNHYCAQCHNAEPTNLRSWDINITCPALPNRNGTYLVNTTYVEEHLTFVNDSAASSNGEWGFHYPNETEGAEREFFACYFPFRPSVSLTPFVRFCRDDLISTCPPSYRRLKVIKACKSYMAMVNIGGRIYKNPHCAICNSQVHGTVDEQALCTIVAPNILKRERREGLSFTVIMDVNTSTGDRVGVGQDDRCPGTQRWDPFGKKCRSSVCAIPSYRIEHGRCVPP